MTATRTVNLYSLVMNGGALKGTLDGHSAGVRCVVSDGDVIASGDEDGKIRLWSLQTCQCTGELEGSNRTVHGLGLKGDTLVSGGYDRAVRIWSVAKRKLLSTMIEHSGTVASVALGQKHVASASTDTTAKLWPLTGHYKSLATLQHPGPVYSVSVHGQSAATAAWTATCVWSLTTFRLTHTLYTVLIASHPSSCWSSVSGSRDTQVKVWTLAGEGECIGTCDHGAPVLGGCDAARPRCERWLWRAQAPRLPHEERQRYHLGEVRATGGNAQEGAELFEGSRGR